MKPQFLKEWTQSQMKQVERSIRRFITSRYWETHHSPDVVKTIVATIYMGWLMGKGLYNESDFE